MMRMICSGYTTECGKGSCSHYREHNKGCKCGEIRYCSFKKINVSCNIAEGSAKPNDKEWNKYIFVE